MSMNDYLILVPEARGLAQTTNLFHYMYGTFTKLPSQPLYFVLSGAFITLGGIAIGRVRLLVGSFVGVFVRVFVC